MYIPQGAWRNFNYLRREVLRLVVFVGWFVCVFVNMYDRSHYRIGIGDEGAGGARAPSKFVKIFFRHLLCKIRHFRAKIM